jgi:hypothetical protein
MWLLRNMLMLTEKSTEVSSISEDFYEFSQNGVHMKVPVRSECVVSQPEHDQNIIHFGLDWGNDGTITTPVDPICGLAYASATQKDISYDPATPWQGENWYLSHGGRLYYTLENNIRANNSVSAADRIKIVKALVAYDEIARAVMLYLTYYHNRIDGQLNLILDTILSSSGGSAMFSSRDDLLGQIVANIQENFFPWPLFDFWAPRDHNAYSLQMPYHKYELFVPVDFNHFRAGMVRLFDAYETTNLYVHPMTYLKGEDLWRTFITDIVPLLWTKQSWKSYVGIDVREYLASIKWAPLSYDYMKIEWLLNKFFVHPFDELAGVGQHELPKHGVTDVVTTMDTYYWESSDTRAAGKVFYLGQDAYKGRALESPWLDPIRFVGITYNYTANNDDADPNASQSLRGNIAYNGASYTDLSYNEYLSHFKRLAFGFQDFELAEPDPDININAQIDTDGFEVNWMEHLLYKDAFKFPIRMPNRKWYFNKRKLHKMYAYFLNLQLDDVEQYKLQQAVDSGNLPSNQLDGDKSRY